MNVMLKSFLYVAISCIVSGCGDDCPQIEEPKLPHEQEVFKFQVVDMGQSSKGYCGKVIIAHLDSNTTVSTKFKAVDLPGALSTSASVYYKGLFRIHPSTYSCKDGWVDPLPGQPAPTISIQMVDILAWQLR